MKIIPAWVGFGLLTGGIAAVYMAQATACTELGCLLYYAPALPYTLFAYYVLGIQRPATYIPQSTVIGTIVAWFIIGALIAFAISRAREER
jgi:hypothetical protein